MPQANKHAFLEHARRHLPVVREPAMQAAHLHAATVACGWGKDRQAFKAMVTLGRIDIATITAAIPRAD